MTWLGPPLDEDQSDLVAMLGAFATDRDGQLADDEATVGALVRDLTELGVWTVGSDEAHGGGGADHVTTCLVLEQLGRHWPALGWASAQSHATLEMLGGDHVAAELVAGLHTGEVLMAVVDATAPHVDLDFGPGSVTGVVHRVDAAHAAPHLLVLGGPDGAVLVSPDGYTSGETLRRTGLAGALTRALSVDATADAVTPVDETRACRARATLWSGAAAVAAGIAGAALDDALEYTAGRHQFGAPLTSLPVVRQSLLDQASSVAVTLRALLAPAGDALQAWAVLRSATESAIDVTAAALQAHGGYGYLEEYPTERRLRDAVSLRAATGVQSAAIPCGSKLVTA
jgi:alkylation response protein AidB-like acyl-CoA dehydrogenase